MIKQPSPRLDALREMREATYERATAARREIDRATAALNDRKKQETMRELQEKAAQAAARADVVAKRRKGKESETETGRAKMPELKFEWNNKNTAKLRAMWADGATQSAIGKALGISSGAISGKATRLNLAKRKQTSCQPRTRVIRYTKTAIEQMWESMAPPKRLNKLPTAIASHEISKKTARSIMKLENHHCRWPIGDPKTPEFHFCGDPSADLGGHLPYCPTHHAIAYYRY